MATDIVGSLFGVTPEMYQQRQAAQADAAALQYAQLTPMQQANYAIGRGAYGLAGALGGALGAQDPQLQLISARNAIAKQINYNDPASIMEGVQSLSQAGDTVGAMQLADVARKLQSEMAQTFQRTAAGRASLAQANRERATSTPADIAKAERIGEIVTALQVPELDEMTRANLQAQLDALRPATKDKPGAAQLQIASEIANQKLIVDALRSQPASPERDAALNRASYTLEGLERQLPQPKPTRLANEIGVAKGTGQPVLLDEEGLFVYKEVGGKQVRTPFSGAIESKTASVKVENLLPGQAVPRKDWMDFTQNVLSKDPVMLRTSTIISDAPAAIDIIRTSTENDISAAALPGALARLTGEGKNMSNEDVRRFARTGGLDDRIAQDVVKFFTGRTTTVKKDQAEKFATALYRGALIERRKKLVDEADQYGYLESPNYKTALRQIDDQLKQIPAPGTKSSSVPTPAVTGGRVTPSDQALLDKYAPRKP